MEKIDFLSKNLQRHLDFVKFAEAKNATLSIASTGAVFGCIQMMANDKITIPSWILFLSCVCFLSSSCITALSFIPKKRSNNLISNECNETPNLLFYEDCKNLDIDLYSKKLSELHNWSNEKDTLMEKQYIEQIIINSKITNRKMDMFHLALLLFISGLTTPVGGIFAFFYNNVTDRRFYKIGNF